MTKIYVQVVGLEKPRKGSHTDITFRDKEKEAEDKEEKENKVVGPKDIVDILAWNNCFYESY